MSTKTGSLDALREVALAALGDVASDPNAPAVARVSAASSLLKFTGDGDASGGVSGSIGDMDLDQIDAELARLAGAPAGVSGGASDPRPGD